MRNASTFSLGFGIVFGLLAAGTVAAWTGPTAPPPGGNVAEPINEGDSDQVKTGGSFTIKGNLGADDVLITAQGVSLTNFNYSQLNLVSQKVNLLANYLVGGINFNSNDSNLVGVPKTAAAILAVTAATHTAANLATDLVFYTTDPAKAVAQETMRLDERGIVAAAGAGFIYGSDARLKTNIATLGNALSKVLAIRGVSFVWKEGTAAAGQKDVGVIAQEVEKVLPEAVHTDSGGYKSVDYPRLVPLLINAIHEQQAQIDELKARIDALEN